MLTKAVVGWLLVAAAVLVFIGGIGLRVLVGRHRDQPAVRRVVGGFRTSPVARVLFGAVEADPLHDDELDGMFVMPAIIGACGLCLVAVFLLGYDVLT
jgi:hypothetical protein